VPIWHGTDGESFELRNAVNRHCGCQYGALGVLQVLCGAHRMLDESQRALDGLLFGRWLGDRLIAEEWSDGPWGRLVEGPARVATRARWVVDGRG
jgi:hypothetical protein